MEIKAIAPVGARILDFPFRADFAGGSGEFENAVEVLKKTVHEEGLVHLPNASLSSDEFVALAGRLGPLEGKEFVRKGNRFGGEDDRSPGVRNPDLTILSNLAPDGSILAPDSDAMVIFKANECWHTDSSFLAVPSSLSLLFAARVPSEGGDTSFASLSTGWREMDVEKRNQFIGRSAEHDWRESVARVGGVVPDDLAKGIQPASHPIVTRHPETGRASFFISGHSHRISGDDRAASRLEIERLVGWLTRPERVYRHVWKQGDLLIWDNRHMLHRAHGFPADEARVMHRITLAGTKPEPLW